MAHALFATRFEHVPYSFADTVIVSTTLGELARRVQSTIDSAHLDSALRERATWLLNEISGWMHFIDTNRPSAAGVITSTTTNARIDQLVFADYDDMVRRVNTIQDASGSSAGFGFLTTAIGLTVFAGLFVYAVRKL